MTLLRAAAGVLLALASLAAAAHERAPAVDPQATAPPWVGPELSGSWYDPARSGEGLILEFLPDGSALAAWFTFPAAGEPGAQAWVIAAAGRVAGTRVHFDVVYTARGARFGAAFDPAAVQSLPWTTLDLDVSGCNTLTATYAAPAPYGSGTLHLTRLTTLDQVDCRGGRTLTASGGRALAGLRGHSGAWFVPARSGEGWFVEELAGGYAVVYWFSFDPTGNPAWLVGVGTRTGERIVVDDLTQPVGTRFGSGFDPAQVQRSAWGRIEFTFSDCNNASVVYSSTHATYGSGAHAAVRATRAAGAACVDATPRPQPGAWSERAAMPAPAQSELDVAVWDGRIYALGGFGDPTGFKRYDPATDAWTTLPPLPSGRNHLAAFALGGGVYYTGGATPDGNPPAYQGYRYDIAANRWDPEPALRYTYGSRAAVLNGRAYIGSEEGSLQEFDPVQHATRRIETPLHVQRDHAQVLAFQDEIWILGGRSPETRSTAIYDPVSAQWRSGPSMNAFRGGFAAAVVGDSLFVGGGEVVNGERRLEPTTEFYAAGAEDWTPGPSLAVPVHGTAAAAIGDAVYVVSGSTAAGMAYGATGRVFALPVQPTSGTRP